MAENQNRRLKEQMKQIYQRIYKVIYSAITMSLIFSIYGQNPSEEKYKSFPQLILLTLTYALSYFYIGYTLAYFTTFSSGFLIINYGLPATGIFRVVCMALIAFGAGFGTLLSKFIVDKYPKREFILILNGVAIALGCLMLWIQEIYIVFIIRLCQGVCVGLYSITIPAILKEMCPPKIMNRVIAVNWSMFSLALVLVYTLAYKNSSIYVNYAKTGMGWTILCAFPLFFVALQSVLLEFRFPYETTLYYLKNQRFIDAENALNVFYKKWQVIEIIRKTEQQIKDKQKPSEFDAQNNIEEENLNLGSNRNYNAGNPLLPSRQSNNFQRQKSKYNIMATFFMVLIQQLSGINALIPYGFYLCYNAVLDKFYFPLLIFLIMMVTCQAMPTLIEKVNRKTIILASTIICAISCSLISYGLYYNEGQLYVAKSSGFVTTGLILMVLNHGCSVGPIFDIYVEEIVPTNFFYIVKAMSWGVAGFAIMGCSTDWRGSIMFLIFSIWSFLSIFINFKFQIETKGKNKAQIEEEYRRMAAAF